MRTVLPREGAQTAVKPALDRGPHAKAKSLRFSEELANEDFNAINVATGRNSDGAGSSATEHFGFATELNPEHFPVIPDK